MNKLREVLANVQSQLGAMKTTHRVLIACVAVTLALVLFIVFQQTRKPAMVELYPGAQPGDQQQFATHLAANGFRYEMQGGRVYVAPADLFSARGMVAEAGLLPNDKAILFSNILLNQSWTNTREQNDKLYNEALQNELEATIMAFRTIKKADVFIDVPPPMGIGQSARRPTAAVSIITRSGEPLTQGAVDAIASLVAGSRAGLSIDAVRIIDGAAQHQRRATRDDEALPTTYLDHAARVEKQTQEKVQELLAYIPGVVVAVTAQVDVTRVTSQTQQNLPVGQGTISLPKKEETTESNSADGTSAPPAIPGVQSNQTADITQQNGAAGTSSKTTSNTSVTESENHVGSRQETTVDPRGFPTMVAVSVNVPRGFVTRVIKASSPDAAASKDEPTEQAIRDAFDKQIKPAIIETIRPQVRALHMQSAKGAKPEEVDAMIANAVGVSLMPMDLPAMEPQTAGLLGSLTSGGGGGGMLGGGLIDKAVLGVLSLIALFMMFSLIKKGGKKIETPTAEEMVGLPPPIETGVDVIGEAEEGETAMTGIEVGDSQMESQKMLEQVGQMVSQSPETVARLVNRWIDRED